MKRIIIFGASGRTGKEVFSVAQARGIEVHAFDKKNPSMDELRQAVRGIDGVVIVFGPRPPYTDIFCTDLTKNIIDAMEVEKAGRLICQTGAMIGEYPKNRSLLFELFSRRLRKSNPQGYNDRAEQEKVIKDSSLEWTIIKPPRLSNAVSDNSVIVGEQIKVGILSSISRRSLAGFIVSELLTPRFICKAIFVKN